MKQKNIPVVGIVLYVLAGILALYTIWSMVNINHVISAQQVPFKGNEYTIISYYMTNAGLYAIFAVVLFSFGWILQQLAPASNEQAAVTDESAEIEQYETLTVDSEEEEIAEEAVETARSESEQSN